jgi:outer membrane lipoprotein SlyB
VDSDTWGVIGAFVGAAVVGVAGYALGSLSGNTVGSYIGLGAGALAGGVGGYLLGSYLGGRSR